MPGEYVSAPSATLLECRRLFTRLHTSVAVNGPGVVVVQVPGAASHADPFLSFKRNRVWRTRIALGSLNCDQAAQTSLQTAGLMATLVNASNNPIFTGIASPQVPATFGAVTALLSSVPISTDWLVLRADDWLLLGPSTAALIPDGWSLQVQVVANFGAGVTNTTIDAFVESEMYQYDNYDLPQDMAR